LKAGKRKDILAWRYRATPSGRLKPAATSGYYVRLRTAGAYVARALKPAATPRRTTHSHSAPKTTVVISGW
jgi:hypothetical protein